MPLTEGALPAPTLPRPGADWEIMRPRPSETRARAGEWIVGTSPQELMLTVPSQGLPRGREMSLVWQEQRRSVA